MRRRAKFGQNRSKHGRGIGYIRSIAIQRTALDYSNPNPYPNRNPNKPY